MTLAIEPDTKEDIYCSMELTVGAIVEGKVKTITKFGAFITLPGNRTGMVHISEVAHVYVNDIHDFLTEGQDVKVKIIEIDPAGKINLSIKKTQDAPPRQQRPRPAQSAPAQQRRPAQPKEPASFDEMLKQFMADSDSKISSIKQYSDHKSKTRRR